MSELLTIEKKNIKQSFSSAATTYDSAALLQRQVGLDFIAKFDIDISNESVVDLGCGTGFLMQQLLPDVVVKEMIAIDIAWSMLQASRSKLQSFEKIHYVCADAERLPLTNGSVDKIISNLALQWCRNLSVVFQGFNQMLKPEGLLLFSTFGVGTLHELKHSWAQVDQYAHVNDFYTEEEMFFFLQGAGFKDIQIESQYYHSSYLSVMTLMKELKSIGANQVISGRSQKLTSRLQMQAMIDAYEKYRSNGVIPATYEVIFVSAKA